MSNSIREAFFKSNIGVTSIVDTIENKGKKRSESLRVALMNNLKIVSVRHEIDVSSLLNIISHDDRWSAWCRNVSMTEDFCEEEIPELKTKYENTMNAINNMTDELDLEGYRLDKSGQLAWVSNLQAGLKACKLIW